MVREHISVRKESYGKLQTEFRMNCLNKLLWQGNECQESSIQSVSLLSHFLQTIIKRLNNRYRKKKVKSKFIQSQIFRSGLLGSLVKGAHKAVITKARGRLHRGQRAKTAAGELIVFFS